MNRLNIAVCDGALVDGLQTADKRDQKGFQADFDELIRPKRIDCSFGHIAGIWYIVWRLVDAHALLHDARQRSCLLRGKSDGLLGKGDKTFAAALKTDDDHAGRHTVQGGKGMQLVGTVDDHLVFKERAGVILCKNGERTLVDIQKFTEIMAVLHAVKGVVKKVDLENKKLIVDKKIFDEIAVY